MNPGALEISWAREKLTLLPERALWWKREKTLFIADPHFGKAAAFRSAGIAVPEASHDADLDRLEKILRRQRAKQLVVLGDFFHAKTGRGESAQAALAKWRRRQTGLKIILVLGNHDLNAGCPPNEWEIECVRESLKMSPFSCCHHPPSIPPDDFTLCGHVHPAFELHERSGLRARSICFYFQQRLAILPAFGNFTGTHTVQPKRGEKVFLIAEDQVIDATGTLG